MLNPVKRSKFTSIKYKTIKLIQLYHKTIKSFNHYKKNQQLFIKGSTGVILFLNMVLVTSSQIIKDCINANERIKFQLSMTVPSPFWEQYLRFDLVVSEAEVLEVGSGVRLDWWELMLQHLDHLWQLGIPPAKLPADAHTYTEEDLGLDASSKAEECVLVKLKHSSIVSLI